MNCRICDLKILDSDRYVYDSKDVYCTKCAYINGKTSDENYLNSVGLSPSIFKVEIINGEIVIYTGKKPSEKKDRDYRKNKQYQDWRKSVFERDEYTCQSCLKKGGELNAHHIKTFKEFVDLRYEIENGLTLCIECHRKVHKKRR